MILRPTVIDGYTRDATGLIPRYEAICPDQLYAHVLDHIPTAPARIIDIGAGTGRDAAWLADQGHHVTAVEPVYPFRAAGILRHPSPRIDWLDSALPDLAALAGTASFDMALCSGVFQHLTPEQQPIALQTISDHLAVGASLILSLRHGIGVNTRPVFPIDPDAVLAVSAQLGLELCHHSTAKSTQPRNIAAGVTWTWLVLKQGATRPCRA